MSTMEIKELINQVNRELPKEIHKIAQVFFEKELIGLCYPDIYVLPLTPEGEKIREYLYSNDEGRQSISRYGAYEYNMTHNGETYLVILVNND